MLCGKTHGQAWRESHVFGGWFKLFVWRQFSGFHLTTIWPEGWPIIWLWPASCPYVVWLRDRPDGHANILAKMDSSSRVSRSLRTYYGLVSVLSFDPWGAFWHMCSWEALLDLKNEKCGHLIFLHKQSQLLFAPAFFFTLKYWQEMSSSCLPGAHLPPTSVRFLSVFAVS